MNDFKEKKIREYRKKFKPYFAHYKSECKKCKHLEFDHMWTDVYDSCKRCGCVDYDKGKDFVNKLYFYDPQEKKLESFISTLIDETEALHCACIFRKQESEEDKNTLIESCKFHSDKLNETRKETMFTEEEYMLIEHMKRAWLSQTNKDTNKEWFELYHSVSSKLKKLKNQEDFTTDERGGENK